MIAVVNLINGLLGFYIFLVFAMVIMSWLYSFGVVPHHNQVINQIMSMLHKITEPGLRRIRAIVPTLGGMDFSPIILLLAVNFLRDLFNQYVAPILIG